MQMRSSPWKVFLPLKGKSPLLAIGLEGKDLASLMRSHKNVDVYQCDDTQINWALKQGQCLGQDYRFNRIDHEDFRESKYAGIAINADMVHWGNPKTSLDLLKPGGTVVWTGRREKFALPSSR